mmetsp:Transcript_12892/g.36256  ORF Transcript_12892/g.36256 Transcript_12892/m.36256 type:complete len:257 (+) Transcript_12892:239-1009(+)
MACSPSKAQIFLLQSPSAAGCSLLLSPATASVVSAERVDLVERVVRRCRSFISTAAARRFSFLGREDIVEPPLDGGAPSSCCCTPRPSSSSEQLPTCLLCAVRARPGVPFAASSGMFHCLAGVLAWSVGSLTVVMGSSTPSPGSSSSAWCCWPAMAAAEQPRRGAVRSCGTDIGSLNSSAVAFWMGVAGTARVWGPLDEGRLALLVPGGGRRAVAASTLAATGVAAVTPAGKAAVAAKPRGAGAAGVSIPIGAGVG